MRRSRVALAGLLALLVIGATACSSHKSASTTTSTTSGASLPVAKRGVVTIPVATVGDPGNPSVGVWQVFKTVGTSGAGVTLPPNGSTGIYKSCKDAPASAPSCLTVGGVDYTYGIGEFDVTVSQYVTFLNTVDPAGKNLRQLYDDNMNPVVWPKYGSIGYSSSAAFGSHYSVAYPEWAQKPFNFGDFRRGAEFVNALFNGKVLSKTSSTSGAFKYTTYTVRLSPNTESGMYNMSAATPTRQASTGFVLPSNNEWVKAAYYDPKGGGTDSYWLYPTGPFKQPNISVLNPTTGDVTNAAKQPLATYNPNDPNSSVDTPGAPAGTAPDWCPSQAGSNCDNLPFDFPPGLDLQKNYMGNVSTVGQAKTPTPWGAYDMAGPVVEHTDTIAPQPPGYHFIRDWRYYHGGVANAPAYQIAIYGFGYFPGDPQIGRIYPWMGFRVGVIGDLK
jgi:formylglycine-generating enzyme required for sulfatase activity